MNPLDRRTAALWEPAARRGYAVDVFALAEARTANPRDWMWKQFEDNLRGGRVYPTITASGTVTGRMTITGPNLHGLSANYRHVLAADPGMAIVGCDLAHIEPTIAAYLSGDQALIEAVHGDPYTALAERIGCDRQIAKRAFLAPLYGQGVKSFRAALAEQGIIITMEQAQQVRADIDATYPQLAWWTRDVVAHAERGALALMLDGTPIARPDAPYKAVNYLVQGSGAMLFKQLCLRADAVLTEAGMPGAAWLPIHDELNVMVPSERAEEALRILDHAMRTTIGGVVPVYGDAKVHGSRLGK